MAVEFTLPDVGEGVAEGEIVQWLVGPGDPVSEDQPMVEVETDKAVVEVPSPVDGTVRELRAEAGDVVPVGDVIVVLDDGGEGETGETGDPADPTAESPATPAAPENGAAAGTSRVFAAPSARRLARELGVDISAVEGSGPGGRVTEADVRAAAEGADGTGETTSGPEPEPESGNGNGTATEPVEGARSTAGGDAPADRDRTLATPATRGTARELGVDIDAVPTAETRDGEAFVTSEAVEAYAETQRAAQRADAAAVSAGTAAGTADDAESRPGDGPPGVETAASAAGEDERLPYRGVRRTVGEQMERSKFTAPHVTHHDQVDVTALVEARADLKPRAAERGVELTYLPFVLKAVVAGLKEYPILNSQLDEAAEEIIKRGEYNIGVATATDAGLMVPVVKGVDRKSVLGVAAETNDLVARARDRSIAREEMQGGTFTVTNFGAVGGEYATPIINHPETAILGLGAVKKRPWVVERETGEEVVPRQVMTLSLSIDHRVIDGAEAARFVNTVTEYLQDPTLLLLE